MKDRGMKLKVAIAIVRVPKTLRATVITEITQ